jgi:hypothetical protein
VATTDSYAPPRALRASLFVGLPARGVAHASVPPFAFVLTFLAVLASFTISGNTLNILGTHYAEPGGNPVLKIHPATYLAVMAAIASLVSGSAAQSRLGYIFGKAPALFFFIGFTRLYPARHWDGRNIIPDHHRIRRFAMIAKVPANLDRPHCHRVPTVIVTVSRWTIRLLPKRRVRLAHGSKAP